MSDKKRGRPRPIDTIDRDEVIFHMMDHDIRFTKKQIALHMQISETMAYLALVRLEKAGRVKQVRDGKRFTWAQKS